MDNHSAIDGGSSEGMGEVDNAPLPPVSAPDTFEPMGDNGENDNSFNDNNNELPPLDNNDNGDENFNDDNDSLEGSNNSEDDELQDILSNLSIEDKAAVTKYAKSMMKQKENDMPNESRKSIAKLIDETFNDIIKDTTSQADRKKKELPKQYQNVDMPFKSPY